MAISKVGVVGCGLMGHGISQICAQAGWDVVVREVDQGALDKGIAKIEKQLGRAVEKGRMEQSDADAVRSQDLASHVVAGDLLASVVGEQHRLERTDSNSVKTGKACAGPVQDFALGNAHACRDGSFQAGQVVRIGRAVRMYLTQPAVETS